MTLKGAAEYTSLEGESGLIARGPVAAMVAIKHLGTNGGGYFGANSSHPFENPKLLYEYGGSRCSVSYCPSHACWHLDT